MGALADLGVEYPVLTLVPLPPPPFTPPPREGLVLDPAEVAVGRTELALHNLQGSLYVRDEGPNWGDHEIAAYMSEGVRGETPVDFRIPNRKITIPLAFDTDNDADFAAIQALLQQKIGLIQREGGWLRRTTRDGRVLYLDIVNATLHYGGGTYQAIDNYDNEVDLTLEAIPDFYGDEIELGTHTETTLPEIDGLEAEVGGDWPGRVSAILTEQQGIDQNGVILAFRSRYYDPADTAKLGYEAEALTPLDTAAVATVSGASGGGSNNVVAHTNLSTDWTGVLSTQILDGGADLTHVGSYQWLARVRSPNGSAVRVRGVYDVGDLTLPEQNDPFTVPAANQFFIADLGTIDLQKIPVGEHRWQGAIQGIGTAGGEDLQIDRVWFVPVDESFTKAVSVQTDDVSLSTFSARDEFNQTAGALAGKTAAFGGTWAGAGDTDGFNVEATGHTAQRTAVSDADINTGRYAYLGAALTRMAVRATFKSSANGPVMGVIARYVDANNWIMFRGAVGASAFTVVMRVAGTVTTLSPTLVRPFPTNTPVTLGLSIDPDGNYLPSFNGEAFHPLAGQNSNLATGGALASGKAGIYDARTSATAATRNVDSFAASIIPADAVVFANRSAELRSDGLFREDSAGVASGPITRPTDMMPRIPNSGAEHRPVQIFLLTTRGDFAALPDGGIDDKSVQIVMRPSWMFVGGA